MIQRSRKGHKIKEKNCNVSNNNPHSKEAEAELDDGDDVGVAVRLEGPQKENKLQSTFKMAFIILQLKLKLNKIKNLRKKWHHFSGRQFTLHTTGPTQKS